MSKTVLITGTSTGFGKLITKTLAKEGHSVIATMRDVSGKNVAAAKELSALHNVEVVELDVTSDASVEKAIQNVIKKHGQIDVLVNNAGVVGFGLFEGTSVEQMKQVFEVNLFGIVRTYQAVLPSMRAQRSGLIINISSGLGIFATPFIVPYIMTKFGVEALTEGVRHEVKQYGIETVSILPGPFPTEITTKAGFGPDKSEVLAAYGPDVQRSFEQFGTTMVGKMEEYKVDSQLVADGVLALINMKAGTRPYQTSINPIAQEIEQPYTNSKLAIKTAWMEKMGWGAY